MVVVKDPKDNSKKAVVVGEQPFEAGSTSLFQVVKIGKEERVQCLGQLPKADVKDKVRQIEDAGMVVR
jgi:hypothetical protein